MTQRRALTVVRLLLGVLLIRQGAIGLSDLVHLSRVMETHNAWQGWPLIGSWRPIEMALWIGASEFTLGIFLVGGLLTRFAALGSALLAAFSLATLSDLGPIPNLAHALLMLGSLAVVIKGGGAGTMDRVLGKMQARSIQREAERKAALAAEQESAARRA